VRYPHTIERFIIAGAVSLLALAFTAVVPAQRMSAAEVTVTFTDTSLRVASPTMPQSGLTTFVVVNRGKKAHMLLISGPGVRNARTSKLAAGGSAKLTVSLRAGAYELSDPVGLGAYNVQFLQIVQATTVSGSGTSNVVQPAVTPPPMCGVTYTP
jgi:hypothetical protein